MLSNKEFLIAIFGNDYLKTHVTDFNYDPNAIPDDKHLISWMGKSYDDYKFKEESNQYFTISLFTPDDQGKSRRRKALFLQTNVITLDDVKEKLSMDEVSKLPTPSYIMETSPGSEQWGYILNEPCTVRSTVENLLDGLVANGLAPAGKDPGMKGVTRYVRLPGGYNTKKSKMIDGKPFKCVMKLWEPFNTATIEELAAPFNVNLEKQRREQRVDGAHNVPDHPLLKCGLHIKEVRSDGRFDITCPWVDEHTDSVDNGTAIFTNEDGTIGFKCHHGACETRTANNLIKHLEIEQPGFTDNYDMWKFKHVLGDIELSAPVSEQTPIENTLDKLNSMIPGVDKKKLATDFLKLIDNLPEIERLDHHKEICDIMVWTKMEFGKIIKDLRHTWYDKPKEVGFYDGFTWVKEQNNFYEHSTGIFYKADAFQNSFSHVDVDVKKNALVNNMVQNVDKMDFAPKMPKIFEKDGIKYFNTWDQLKEDQGIQGDCSKWLSHWDVLGWGDDRDHMLKWMAYTIRHPENKINHILMLGGYEGIGKDLILSPFFKAMGKYSRIENGSVLLSGFNSYLLNSKHIHFNETEIGDMREAEKVNSKLKPLATAPPERLTVDQKYLIPIEIQNIVNISMTTNSQMPIKLSGTSRRFYAVWSNLDIRDSNQEMKSEWRDYFDDIWTWMRNGGMDHCIYYLRNNVDLSDFDPRSTPKMTEFLRDITESSKSSAQQTIEAFIENKIGAFSNDIITSTDACATLKSGLIDCEEYMYTDAHWFTPTKVGRVMRDIQGCIKLRVRSEGKEIRPWAIRKKDEYEKMNDREIYELYKRSKNEI